MEQLPQSGTVPPLTALPHPHPPSGGKNKLGPTSERPAMRNTQHAVLYGSLPHRDGVRSREHISSSTDEEAEGVRGPVDGLAAVRNGGFQSHSSVLLPLQYVAFRCAKHGQKRSPQSEVASCSASPTGHPQRNVISLYGQDCKLTVLQHREM